MFTLSRAECKMKDFVALRFKLDLINLDDVECFVCWIRPPNEQWATHHEERNRDDSSQEKVINGDDSIYYMCNQFYVRDALTYNKTTQTHTKKNRNKTKTVHSCSITLASISLIISWTFHVEALAHLLRLSSFHGMLSIKCIWTQSQSHKIIDTQCLASCCRLDNSPNSIEITPMRWRNSRRATK